MSNLLTLVQNVPTPLIVAWVLSNLIPYLSALATKAPTWATGAITVVLAFVTGFLGEWAAAGDGPFDVKSALGAFAVSWVIARLQHKTLLSDTYVEAKLHHDYGNKGLAKPAAA